MSRSGSAVDETTKSTGKSPPPGSGGGTVEITRMPGIFETAAPAASWSCSVFRVRSSQGFATNPPKPPVGVVIWKMLSVSGSD